MSVLCVISGMVFSLPNAIIMNTVFLSFFFIVKYIEGHWIGGGWAMMILNIRKGRFLKQWVVFLWFHIFTPFKRGVTSIYY